VNTLITHYGLPSGIIHTMSKQTYSPKVLRRMGLFHLMVGMTDEVNFNDANAYQRFMRGVKVSPAMLESDNTWKTDWKAFSMACYYL